MEEISISQISDTNKQQPFTGKSLQFLQNAIRKDEAGIIEALVTKIVGSYSLTVPYVISGCVLSDSNKDVTAGTLFYGGKFYETTSVNGTTNVARFIKTKSQDATADPITFSDSSTGSVHDIYKYVPTDVASGGDFVATDLVYLVQASNDVTVVTTNTSNGQTIDVSIVSGSPFTYNNDVYTYSYYVDRGICYLNFEVEFDVTDGAIVDKIHLPLPTGITKLTTLTATQSFKGSASMSAPGGTTNYLTLQTFSNDGGSEGQRITLKRFQDGDTDITLSAVNVVLRGEIKFMV
jgi:hypothetical protein